MEIKKSYFLSASLFTLGLLILIVIDYSIRQYTSNLYSLGLPELVWFLFQILFSIASIVLFLRNTKFIPIKSKLMVGSMLIVSGIIIYILIIYGYVIGTQIDGF